MSDRSEKSILTLMIRSEPDVVLARKRARQVALLLGFDTADQTRISTAVSEIVRNGFVHGGGGKLDFRIQDSVLPYTFIIVMADKGPGIKNLEEILKGSAPFAGLRGSKKLVDTFDISSSSTGTTVRMAKKIAPRLPFKGTELDEIANSLTKLISTNPADEVYQQNQELLLALEQLSETKARLDQANAELKDTNSDLTALNNQMRDWNMSLEASVEQRTAELQALNLDLLAARDEAILANELKTQFVANVSHEIRTPMAGILGLSEVLTMSELNGEASEISQHIFKAAHHLLSIVNDILDFSKLDAGKVVLKKNKFYISSLFDEVVQSIHFEAKKKDLKVTDSVHPNASTSYWGDSQRLKQVILNLAHNAVKFTEKGSIQLSATARTVDDAISTIRIEVKDDGIGISEANQKQLFQPFVQADGSTTRRYGGTGLGLAICRSIVEQMGGAIGCQSSPDAGSLFFLEIPLEKVG